MCSAGAPHRTHPESLSAGTYLQHLGESWHSPFMSAQNQNLQSLSLQATPKPQHKGGSDTILRKHGACADAVMVPTMSEASGRGPARVTDVSPESNRLLEAIRESQTAISPKMDDLRIEIQTEI